MNSSSTKTTTDKIVQWHYDRNLIEGATDKDQMLKLVEEFGELANAIAKNDLVELKDAIGDINVVLINIAERNGFKLEECLDAAYDEIKDRKGRMVNGVFVKESFSENMIP